MTIMEAVNEWKLREDARWGDAPKPLE